MRLTKEIQKAIGVMQVLKFHPVVCENVSIRCSELDVMSLNKSGFLCGFEVKISRSDFKADQQKHRHLFYKATGTHLENEPNYFSYVCPDGLIALDEIPAQFGLYYFEDDKIKEVRKPKLLHSLKKDKDLVMEIVCRISSERHFLGCARLTYNNRKNKSIVDDIIANPYWHAHCESCSNPFHGQKRDRFCKNCKELTLAAPVGNRE